VAELVLQAGAEQAWAELAWAELAWAELASQLEVEAGLV